MSKTAKLLREVEGFTGTAKLWQMTPPLGGHRFVVSSAVVAMFSGPETSLFGSDEKGEVTDWGELEGSFCGGLDHEEAIRRAGYTVV